MPTPTPNRMFITGTNVLVAIFILLTLYNLGRTRRAPYDSPGPLIRDNKDTASLQYHVTESVLPLPDTPRDEQNTIGGIVDDVSPSRMTTTSAAEIAIPSATVEPNEPRRAFMTFLAAEPDKYHGKQSEGTVSDDEDLYFVATRVLGYQLMHQPQTRTNTSIPYVVVVTHEVSQSKRARLEKDGAKVVVVDTISDPAWLNTVGRYQCVMNKLRIFQQTEFDKVLYMDADMLVTRRMDAIFEEEATRIQEPDHDMDIGIETAPLPSSFLMAGQAQQVARLHDYPPDPSKDWFCSGFMVVKPSQEIFEYYSSILEREYSFDPAFPDQNLLNYAHRWDGPMPWTKVYYKWTSTYPTIKEYAMGAATLHEKYWKRENRNEQEGQNVLGDMWSKVKRDMETFYRNRNGVQAGSRFLTTDNVA